MAVVVENVSQTGPVWWVPLELGLLALAAGIVLLERRGDRTLPLWRRPGDTLGSLTGLPSWCAAALALALWSLAVAVVGFTWDVAWHADLGRDKELFTPPHVMILTGLLGIAASALLAIALASVERARVGLAIGRLRLPWSVLPMGLMAVGALIGFPLDDYWHRTYGIDVTMWSPTHLLMIGGASLTPIAMWLMLAESGRDSAPAPRSRLVSEALAGATLIGLSTFQLEFDLGIPQWQALYHPVLIALAMSIGLVAAREALGRGGALRAVAGFLVLRGLIALLVGGVFSLSLERFPLYIGGALVVEAVFALTPRMLPAARVILAGLVIATAGLAVEWLWTQVWSPQPWQPRLLASWWVVVLMALAGSFLGSALGRAVSHAPQVVHYSAVAVAFLVLVGMLAVPFPRHGLEATATITATPQGGAIPTVTRDGLYSAVQDMSLTVSVSPPTAAAEADVFRIMTWQGGSIVIHPLHSAGGGRYTIDGTIPTGGSWKSIVFLERGDVVAALPVSFPADPAYGLAAIPAPTAAPRTDTFQPSTAYLTRESHSGSALPAVLAYTTLGLIFAGWCIAVIGVGEAMRRRLVATLPLPGAFGRAG